MGVTSDLADWVVGYTFDKIPYEVVTRAKNIILDSFTCGISGYRTVSGKIVIRYVRELGGKKESRIFGYGDRTNCVNATFANTVIANALDADETYKNLAHPAVPTLASALAVGEKVRATGKDVLASFVAGYEVYGHIRTATIASPERYRQIHGMETWQIFGPAVAAGKILKLNKEQMLDTFGLAGGNAPVQSGWIYLDAGFPLAKYGAPLHSMIGVASALLAREGFTSARTVLEDVDHPGFWFVAGSDRCNFNKMTENLGEKFEILGTSLKPYPACRFLNPALDAVRRLHHEYGFRANEIERIMVRGFPIHLVPMYTRFWQHTHSFPYCLAMALLEDPGPKWFEKKYDTDPMVRSLAGRVQFVQEPDFERIFPAEIRTEVEIVLKNGRKFSKFIMVPKGDPDNPMTEDDVIEKLKNYSSGILIQSQIDEIVETISNLEKLDDITELTKLMKVET